MDNLKNAINEYLINENLSLSVIARKHKTSFRRLKKELTKLNQLRPKAANYSIFDNIDSNEKAYWLGLIFADGCISSKNYNSDKYEHYIFELGLHVKDSKHIEDFAKFIEFKNKIVNTAKMTRVIISNKHLWESLNSLGCVPKKSTILEFPNYLTNNQLPHFIRGYCDGDGCLTFCNKEHTIPKLSFIGNFKFIDALNKVLPVKKYNSIIKEAENVYVITYTGKKAFNISKWMYEQKGSKLQRKFEKYIEFRRLYEES